MELARAVADRSGCSDPEAFAAALASLVGDIADYETSVRLGSDGRMRSGRMMIERAPSQLVTAIARALDVSLPEHANDWLRLAAAEQVPLIAGWDRRDGTDERCIKLYVNASDAGVDTRARLCAQLLPGIPVNHSAAVIGMNAQADGTTETKLYVQAADARSLAAGLGSAAVALADAACAERADAGGVLSYDTVGSKLEPRAFFVALREPPSGRSWNCVNALEGWDPAAAEALLAFAPAQPRSIGVSLADGRWTLYAKPRDSFRAPDALEPRAVFRAGDCEVGIFVEPNEHAKRAFRRTELHAVSIRVREGDPSSADLEALVDWFVVELRGAERRGEQWEIALAGALSDPPAPWRQVVVAAGNTSR